MKTIIIFLVLFSAAVQAQPVWVQNYNSGVAFGLEYAYDVAVDAGGNIYITGSSSGNGTGRDPMTVKYNSAGGFLWAKRMLAVGNHDEEAFELALDDSGNVYVCGQEYEAGFSTNGKLLKYSSSGTELFDRVYNRSGAYDVFNDMVLDDSGNVYVTGYSQYNNGLDIVLAKYNAAGTLKWASFYTSPGAGSDVGEDISIDSAGNLLVVGSSKLSPGLDGLDAVILKFNPAGTQLWVKTYAGLANKIDLLNSVAVDGLNNVYAGGYIVDDSLHYTDYLLVKLDAGGNQQWVKKVNSPSNGPESIADIVLDNSNNIYITGGYYVTGESTNILAAKYNSSGDLLWSHSYNSSGANKPDYATELAIDNSGNVFICGDFSPATGIFPDAVLVKYNNAGIFQGAYTYDRSGKSDNFYGIAIDPNGNPVVTGRSEESTTDNDMLTIKYNAVIGITPISSEVPKQYSLSQNYPNPFNPVTNIEFSVPKAAFIRITVYDMLGRELETIVNEDLNAGTYKSDWNASGYTSGIYFYKLVTESFTETKKMILIK